MYMNYVLEHSKNQNQYIISQKSMILPETELYAFFGTIESIEKEIFKMFVDKTIDLLNKNKEYELYDMKGKMLSFYFTFFEILTANRSYVVLVLKEHDNQLKN